MTTSTAPGTPASTPTPDLAAIKARQQQTWASGDYAAVAARIASMAELLVDAADLAAGSSVLDVAPAAATGPSRLPAPGAR